MIRPLSRACAELDQAIREIMGGKASGVVIGVPWSRFYAIRAVVAKELQVNPDGYSFQIGGVTFHPLAETSDDRTRDLITAGMSVDLVKEDGTVEHIPIDKFRG